MFRYAVQGEAALNGISKHKNSINKRGSYRTSSSVEFHGERAKTVSLEIWKLFNRL